MKQFPFSGGHIKAVGYVREKVATFYFKQLKAFVYIFPKWLLCCRKQDILSCLEEGTEGCLTLVGNIECDQPMAAFVRLANAIIMHNTIEVKSWGVVVVYQFTIINVIGSLGEFKLYFLLYSKVHTRCFLEPLQLLPNPCVLTTVLYSCTSIS